MKRTVVIILETDSKEQEDAIIIDLKMEISGCWNTFEVKEVLIGDEEC
jgi:hypothetical protein